MLEIPESYFVAKELSQRIKGKVIKNVYANSSPHSFAWYFGDPNDYAALLIGKTIGNTDAYAGQVEIKVQEERILFGDGINIRLFTPDEKLPAKHQLLIEFEDGYSLVGSVQMYGGLWAFHDGQNENPYYLVAKEKPSPLNQEFDRNYFNSLMDFDKAPSLSAKAFLATEQRIPGLGNGVLQDILYNAGLHPKRKLKDITAEEMNTLFEAVKFTLKEMADKGGRDTEKNIYGKNGGYITKLSKNTLGKPCPACGTPIKKENYLGGSIYYCERCQK